MAHFYGTLKGSRGKATRLGSKSSGIVTYAAGWRGAVRVEVWNDADANEDRFRVLLTPWQSSGGVSRTLAEGLLDASNVETSEEA